MPSSSKRNYHDEQSLKLNTKIREICKELPPWFTDFIRATSDTLEPRTRFNYCIDTRIFLNYLISENSKFYGYRLNNVEAEKLGELTRRDLDLYLDYLSYYVRIGETKGESEDDLGTETEYENGEHGKARKIASLRSLFKYLYKSEIIKANPTYLIPTPKIHEKSITRLTPEEVSSLIKAVNNGEGLSDRQRSYQKKTLKRDIAMITLFLTTGIRVSELVGIDIEDVDFETNSFRVIRKGGNESILYFNRDTAAVLNDYIQERQNTGTYDRSSPLFISMQNKRITVRAVENLIKKYAMIAVPLKKITPHKLRSTFGTMLYQNTGDIYLVADVLGHKDVNTTRKHYAAQSEDNRKYAANAVKITENISEDEE